MCADCLYAITSSNWATEKSFAEGASQLTQPANIPTKELVFRLCSKSTQVLQKWLMNCEVNVPSSVIIPCTVLLEPKRRCHKFLYNYRHFFLQVCWGYFPVFIVIFILCTYSTKCMGTLLSQQEERDDSLNSKWGYQHQTYELGKQG